MSKRKGVVRTDHQGNSVTFTSAATAAKQSNVSPTNISKCCNGQRQSVNGYQFRFADAGESPSYAMYYLDELIEDGTFSLILDTVAEEQNKKIKHKLQPKILFFIHRIIEGKKKAPQNYRTSGVTINARVMAEKICDNWSTVASIKKALEYYDVIQVVNEADQLHEKSTTFKLTEKYEDAEVVEERYSINSGGMIKNLIEWTAYVDANKSGEWSVLAEEDLYAKFKEEKKKKVKPIKTTKQKIESLLETMLAEEVSLMEISGAEFDLSVIEKRLSDKIEIADITASVKKQVRYHLRHLSHNSITSRVYRNIAA